MRIVEVEPITAEEGWVKGKVAFTTGEPVVGGLEYKLICVTTKGKGDEKEVETSTIAEQSVLIGVAMDEPGSKTEDFTFQYDFKNWLEKKGGVLGAASKLAKFAANTFGDKKHSEYYVTVTANVKGVWNSPSDRKLVSVNVAV